MAQNRISHKCGRVQLLFWDWWTSETSSSHLCPCAGQLKSLPLGFYLWTAVLQSGIETSCELWCCAYFSLCYSLPSTCKWRAMLFIYFKRCPDVNVDWGLMVTTGLELCILISLFIFKGLACFFFLFFLFWGDYAYCCDWCSWGYVVLW